MKNFRLLIYFALGYLGSSPLLLFFGSGGRLEYKTLNDYRTVLSGNIKELKNINNSLLAELDALSYDPERVALQARELGYLKEDEGIIKIEGYSPAKSYFTVGKIIRRTPSNNYRFDWIFKLLGMIIPLTLYLFYRLALRKDGYANRN